MTNAVIGRILRSKQSVAADKEGATLQNSATKVVL